MSPEEAAVDIQNKPDYHLFKVEYSKDKRMLFECKRIHIDERFKSDEVIEKHAKKYSDKLNSDL